MLSQLLTGLLLALLLEGAATTTDPVGEQRRLDQVRLRSAAWMKLIREADLLTEKKQWTAAEEKIQQVLAEREKLGLDLSSERSALARMYAKAGQKEKAEEFFKATVDQRQKDYGDDDFTLVYPLNEYADFLQSTGRSAEATALKKRATAIESDAQKPPKKRMDPILADSALTKPEKARKLLALGQQFLERDNAVKARFCLDAAIEHDPKLAQAFISRAQAHYQLEELKKALSDLNTALTLEPKNATALADRGRIHQSLEQPQLALKDFTASIAIRPDDLDTLGYRAKQYEASGLTQKAIDDYSRILKLTPNTRWAIVQRSLLYSKLKKYPQALSDLNHAVEIGPENSDNYEMRAELLIKANKMPDALKDATKLVELAPDYTTGYALRAKIYKAIEGAKSAHAAADLKEVTKRREAASSQH